jgi:hypothetical protein
MEEQEMRQSRTSNSWDVHEMQNNKKGSIVPGEKIATLQLERFPPLGKTMTIKSRERKVRCAYLMDSGKRVIIVE